MKHRVQTRHVSSDLLPVPSAPKPSWHLLLVCNWPAKSAKACLLCTLVSWVLHSASHLPWGLSNMFVGFAIQTIRCA